MSRLQPLAVVIPVSMKALWNKEVTYLTSDFNVTAEGSSRKRFLPTEM